MPKDQRRILQLCSSSATSGAERHVLSLSQTLRNRGHHLHLCVHTDGWLPQAMAESGIGTEVLPMKGVPSLRSLLKMAQRVRSGEFDIVHTHLTRAAYFGHMLGLLTHVPIITSVHIANNDVIYKRLAKRRNKLVAVSNFVRGMLHGRGVPERYIETIYNGTDFVGFPTSPRETLLDELRLPHSRQLVGLIGKVCKDKGHLEMVRAATDIVRRHPDAHMLFVGRIESDFRPELDETIAQSGVADRITITGVRHDIPSVLDAVTLCTLPSKMETFGVAAIEAMARCRAVVATRVGALPEVVRHRQTGLLVDLRPQEIADAVGYLLENVEERSEMGRMGRYVVEQKFTLDEMTRRFEDLYQRQVAA